LWPEGAIEMGLLKNKWLIKLSYYLEKLCYQTADRIITLSPGMSSWIQNKYGYTHITDIPNACDNDIFGKILNSDNVLPSWTKDIPYAVYTGNIGEINNSKLLLNTAVHLNQMRDI